MCASCMWLCAGLQVHEEGREDWLSGCGSWECFVSVHNKYAKSHKVKVNGKRFQIMIVITRENL